MLKILLDTDIGGDIDDAICLAYLLREPECELVGITTTCGESEKRAAVADAICRAAGREIPIIAGNDLPLQPIPVYPTPDGAAALADWPHAEFAKGDAPEFIYRKLRENPGEIVLLCIGNMTNPAILFRDHPDAAGLLKGLYTMNGYFGEDALPEAWHNWNAWADPLASKICFSAPVADLRAVPLEVTETLTVDAGIAAAYLPANSDLMRAVYSFGNAWLESSRRLTLHDPLAAVCIFHPEICTYERGFVSVETENEATMGATGFVSDPDGNVRIARSVDSQKFYRILSSALSGRKRVVSPFVTGKAHAAGERGMKWLDELDGIVDELECKWNIRVGEPMSGGSRAFVADAHSESGEPMIIKVELPDNSEDEYLNSIRALRLADGHGYAKLYACEPAHRACLLEKLGGTLNKTDLPPDRQMEIICEALTHTWQMSVEGAELPTGGTDWFREYIPSAWGALGEPCPANVIAQAMQYLDALDISMDRSAFVLVHGDAHNNNMLQTLSGDGFKLIDPDGMIYDKSYDLGVLMREWPDEYSGNELAKGLARSAFLSRLTGVDERAIWQWGYLQMVATSLILLQSGVQKLGRQMLDIAEKWCDPKPKEVLS